MGKPLEPRPPRGAAFLNWVERVGNRLPDPAMLFFVALVLTWVLSAALSGVQFADADPRTGKPIEIHNLLTGAALVNFLATMVTTFVTFPPLGVVLVAMLGVGVAEHAGFINAVIKALLSVTPGAMLTPMLVLVGIISHTAADTGYVLVIPLGGVIFYAAGRHPIAGIVAAFAGVSGGFSANFIPSGIDPLLQGFTQQAAQILDPGRLVNPLCNWAFMSASTLLVVGVCWYLTDRVIEPRLTNVAVDGEPAEMPQMHELSAREFRALWLSLTASAACAGLLAWAAAPSDSPLRAPGGELTAFAAPIMQSIIPLIFLFFLAPGIVYGYAAGTIRTHKDIVAGMSKAMGSMSYYLVMAFFAALFTAAFARSNLGALLAIKGAEMLKALALPGSVTVGGIVFLTAFVNLLVGSASAKWALLAPIFVPILMGVGLSPELTQAAYRIGDSTTNIVTPLMPYFPLVVVYCSRYVRQTGIGTLISLMLPYCVTLLVIWSAFLALYWALGLPLGIQAPYTYP